MSSESPAVLSATDHAEATSTTNTIPPTSQSPNTIATLGDNGNGTGTDTGQNKYPLIPIPSPPNGPNGTAATYDFTDHSTTFSIQMSCIHNVFIRALNSIYYHAPLLLSSSHRDLIAAFAHYTLTWTHLIHHHHHMEETIVFPFLQSAFAEEMRENVEQHRMFSEGVDELEGYMKSVLESMEGKGDEKEKEKWDGERVRAIVEGFGEALVQHLFDEIPTISPERLSQLDKKGLNAMMDVLTQSIQSLPMGTGHSMILTHHDIQTCPNWPPAPAPITWMLKNIAYWRHRSYWKFAPYTRHSEPQDQLKLA